jgi:hypothetical protein
MNLTHIVSLRAASLSATGILAAALLFVACSGNSTPTTGASTAPTLAAPTGTATLPTGSSLPTSGLPSASSGVPTDTPAPGDTAAPTDTAAPGDTGAPEASGSTTGGDIPDNAVFLTYKDATHAFSIDYVEGWQVTTTTDGVEVRDKDSSETVTIVPPVTDVAAYVSGTDLPALQATPPFRLEKQDTVRVHGRDLIHLVYHVPSPPDPVTGKQVPSTIDRYYVPGANGLAIVSLSTPNGVDNVDAFRQMIESFKWL